MSFTANDVMALRQKTGLGMMDCKNALTEKEGDIAAAEQWLRETKKEKMDTRTERATGEGRIGVAYGDGCAVIVEIQTETDFTARTESFVEMVEQVATMATSQGDGDVEATDEMVALVDDIRITTGENANFARGRRLSGDTFGHYVHHDGKRAALVQVDGSAEADTLKGVCQHIVFHDPAGISAEDVEASTIEDIKTTAIAEAVESGKPEEIAGKIAEGKVRKYLEENTLMAQKYVLDESKTVADVMGDATISAFVRYTLGS